MSFEGGRVTDLAMDAERWFNLNALYLDWLSLKKNMTKMSFITNKQKDEVVKEILVNPFHEDVKIGDTNNPNFQTVGFVS